MSATNCTSSYSILYLIRSLRSLVTYRVEHSKIKFVSTRGHVISSIYHHRSISPKSVQLSPMGSELSWGLLASQSESRKFLCPNMEGLFAALKSAAKIHVQCFSKMYSSVSRLSDNQSLQSHLLGSKNDKGKY